MIKKKESKNQFSCIWGTGSCRSPSGFVRCERIGLDRLIPTRHPRRIHFREDEKKTASEDKSTLVKHRLHFELVPSKPSGQPLTLKTS